MKTKIDKVGCELEGYWGDSVDLDDGIFKRDGSVDVNGYSDCENQDCECNCFENCECEDCLRCRECDSFIRDCNCDTCLICDSCENHYEDCDCNPDRCKKCKNKDNACEPCFEMFYDNQERHYSCRETNHTYVECDTECDCECECGSHNCDCCDSGDGEIVSIPFKDIDKLIYWVNKYYPDEVNNTCGIHVHLSFINNLGFMKMTDEKLYKQFKTHMIEFGHKIGIPDDTKFYTRLEGTNNYCTDVFKPQNQRFGGDRYTIFNFSNYTQNSNKNTLEIRVLPCFEDKEFAKKCIREIYNFIEDKLCFEKDPQWNKTKLTLEEKI